MKFPLTALLIGGALAASAFTFAYAAMFNVAADEPHSAFTYAIMETVRSRSIATRARDVRLPPLDDTTLIATGARHQAAMCSDSHLAPDKKESQIRAGLYPRPPGLTKHLHASPAQAFRGIKHGIKMSGMPAWGVTHDNSRIWARVASPRKLPELTPSQCQALAGTNGESHYQHSHDQHDQTGATKSSQHTENIQKAGDNPAMR